MFFSILSNFFYILADNIFKVLISRQAPTKKRPGYQD